jgi:predicted AAA+ superfamily ATPase
LVLPGPWFHFGSTPPDLSVAIASARLLSREVATSLRGRAMEVLVHPFSFREALRLST